MGHETIKDMCLNGINQSAATRHPVYLDHLVLTSFELMIKREFLNSVGYVENTDIKHDNIEMWICN